MVVVVRCPAEACRKFMLVEAAEQGHVVKCLVCKSPIRVPTGAATPATQPAATANFDFTPSKK